jgi:RimJ/RimL family protein N-acetyltransferase
LICGEEVGLRPVLEEDLALLGRWHNDALMCATFYPLFLMSESALRNWHRDLLTSPNRMRFMIQRLGDRLTVGIVGLEHIDYRNQEAELAGLVVAPEERRHGWATKGVQTLSCYAFDDLNLHRLYVRIYGSNHAAQRVFEKAGFQCEGVARQAVFHDFCYEDVIYMAVLREEWRR